MGCWEQRVNTKGPRERRTRASIVPLGSPLSCSLDPHFSFENDDSLYCDTYNMPDLDYQRSVLKENIRSIGQGNPNFQKSRYLIANSNGSRSKSGTISLTQPHIP